jgi:hypothetical protein
LINEYLTEINNYKLQLQLCKTFISENNLDIACSICLDNIDTFSSKKTLECEHTFHKQCLKLLTNHLCPICRSSSNRF